MKELEENNIYFYFNRKKLIKNFQRFNELGNIYYPLKTNSNELVLKTLKPLIEKENNYFLISSIEHFNILRKLNVSPLKMCLINVLEEKDTLKYLYENGLRYFTFDNLKSLKEFSKIADLSNVKIAVRLSTMNIFSNKFTHLGADLEESIDTLKFLQDNKCNDFGLAFYIQNNIKNEEKVLEKIFDYLKQNLASLKISFVNIGGLRKEDMHEIKIDIEQINLEIGRYLVEDCIEVETRIIRTKKIKNQNIVIIKNGIFSGFFDVVLYNKKFDIYLKSKNNAYIKIEYVKTKDDNFVFYMCGGSSDSGDKLGIMSIDSKYKDELIEGAKIRIKNAGAYFEEFFMPYSKDLKKVFIEVE